MVAKWVESAGLALLMGLCGFLVMRWLSENQPAVQQHLLLIPSLLSASIGALFGATIPHWYRKTVRGAGVYFATEPVQSGTEEFSSAV